MAGGGGRVPRVIDGLVRVCVRVCARCLRGSHRDCDRMCRCTTLPTGTCRSTTCATVQSVATQHECNLSQHSRTRCNEVGASVARVARLSRAGCKKCALTMLQTCHRVLQRAALRCNVSSSTANSCTARRCHTPHAHCGAIEPARGLAYSLRVPVVEAAAMALRELDRRKRRRTCACARARPPACACVNSTGDRRSACIIIVIYIPPCACTHAGIARALQAREQRTPARSSRRLHYYEGGADASGHAAGDEREEPHERDDRDAIDERPQHEPAMHRAVTRCITL